MDSLNGPLSEYLLDMAEKKLDELGDYPDLKKQLKEALDIGKGPDLPIINPEKNLF